MGTTTLIEELRAAINRRLVTAKQRNAMAFQLGINRTYVAMIKSGKSSPLGLMFRIADELGIEIQLSIDGHLLR